MRAETHILSARTGDWQCKLRKMGWQAAFSPSLELLVTSAPKAGASVMTRMHIASSNASDGAGPSGRPTDFTAATLHIAGVRYLLGQHISHMVWVFQVPTLDDWHQMCIHVSYYLFTLPTPRLRSHNAKLALPRPFVQLMTKNKKPDPSSKRAKRQAAFQNLFSES